MELSYELVEEINGNEKMIKDYTEDYLDTNAVGAVRLFGHKYFKPYTYDEECMKSDISAEVVDWSEYVFIEGDYYGCSKAFIIANAPDNIKYTMKSSFGELYTITLEEAVDYYNSTKIAEDNLEYVKSLVLYDEYGNSVLQISYYDCTYYGKPFHRKIVIPIKDIDVVESESVNYFNIPVDEMVERDRVNYLSGDEYFVAHSAKVF